MEKIDLLKRIRGINTYSNVIDTNFTEFVSAVVEQQQTLITVTEFFAYYDQLFYDIPLTGTNSHTSIVERSSQYLGGGVMDEEKQALIEEINSLRQQLIDLSQTYANIDQFMK